MGVDTTYIPVDEKDIQYLIKDVIEKPELIEQRVQNLSHIKPDIEHLKNTLYPTLLKQTADLHFDTHFGLCAAAILGYRHPYYYQQNTTIEQLTRSLNLTQIDWHQFFHCFSEFFPSVASAGVSNERNYRTGMYVPRNKVSPLLELLNQSINSHRSREYPSGLIHALKYAQQHHTGVLEAFDLVIPAINDYSSCCYHFRAEHLNNLDNQYTARDCNFGRLLIVFPAPSSSTCSSQQAKAFTQQWVDEEPLLSPLKELSTKDQNGRPVSLKVSLVSDDDVPLIVIDSCAGLYLPNSNDYIAQINQSLGRFLYQKQIDTRYVISFRDVDALPDEFEQRPRCELGVAVKPTFMWAHQKLYLLVDGLDVVIQSRFGNKFDVCVNGKCVDTLHSQQSQQHTLFFHQDQWYAITVRNLVQLDNAVQLSLYKTGGLVTAFAFDTLSRYLNQKAKWMFVSMEAITLLAIALAILMPQGHTLLMSSLCVGLIYLYDRRLQRLFIQLDLSKRH